MIHDIGIVLALVKSPIKRITASAWKSCPRRDIANASWSSKTAASPIERQPDEPEEGARNRVFQDGRISFARFHEPDRAPRAKKDVLAFGLKMKIGLVKPGDFSQVPVHQIPIEKGEPLALELAHFVESVAEAKQPKVNAANGQVRPGSGDRHHRPDPGTGLRRTARTDACGASLPSASSSPGKGRSSDRGGRTFRGCHAPGWWRE